MKDVIDNYPAHSVAHTRKKSRGWILFFVGEQTMFFLFVELFVIIGWIFFFYNYCIEKKVFYIKYKNQ